MSFALAAPARALEGAEERVLVLATPEAPPPRLLLDALRIQLSGTASVEEGALVAGGGAPARIRVAAEIAHERQALLSVWLERDGQDEVLYVVGRRKGRALVEVLPAPSGDDPAAARAVALKVREVVDSILAARELPQVSHLLEPPAPPAPPAPLEEEERGPPVDQGAPPVRWEGELRVGAQVAIQDRAQAGQWGAVIAGGPVLVMEGVRLGALIELGFAPEFTARSAQGEIELRELWPALALGVRTALGRRLGVGARARISADLLHASGRTVGDSSGDADPVLSSLALLAELDVELIADLRLCLAAGAHVRILGETFRLNEREALDASGVRPMAQLSLAWGLR